MKGCDSHPGPPWHTLSAVTGPPKPVYSFAGVWLKAKLSAVAFLAASSVDGHSGVGPLLLVDNALDKAARFDH